MADGHEPGTGGPLSPRATAALESRIAANLRDVRGRLERAARSAGRDPAGVRLIAVSKTVGAEYVRAAAAAGQIDFGENRVQEALDKCSRLTDLPIQWHLVGHLQSNKVRKAVGAFSWIHSVDSIDLLRRLDREADRQRVAPSLLVQVDLAGETTKHGASAPDARAIIEAGASCRAVRICGLMLLPPLLDDPQRVRPFFGRLRELRDEMLAAGSNPAMLRHLSMGMSHDFAVAVEEGSTMVRIGTAIFGRRPDPGPHPGAAD